jgi:hypothetical protein
MEKVQLNNDWPLNFFSVFKFPNRNIILKNSKKMSEEKESDIDLSDVDTNTTLVKFPFKKLG